MSQFGGGVSSAINHLRATTYQWHHPYISRAEGAQLLEGCEAGSFILRESSKGGSYALSVVLPTTGALGHYLVEKRGPERFCLQGSENSFCAIEELLAHYHHHDSIGLPCRLRLPQLHSSSMSFPSRPNLPALPPRNNSRAGSVSRPSRNHTKLSPSPSASARHLDVGRSYPSFPGGDADPSPGVPVGGYPAPPRSPIPSHSPRSVGPPQPHPPPPQQPHQPPPHQAHPLSPRNHATPPSTADEEFGETYEDMSAGPGHRSTGHPMDDGDISGRSGVGSRAMQSHSPSPRTHSTTPTTADEEFGETYEDMSAAGTMRPAGHPMDDGSGRPGSVGRNLPPHSPSPRNHPTTPPTADEEFGETYEDMSAASAIRSAGHPMDDGDRSGRPGAATRNLPPHSPHSPRAHAPAAVAEEIGETYEDMSASSALRSAGHAMAAEPEDQEMYEDMASVSPSLRR